MQSTAWVLFSFDIAIVYIVVYREYIDVHEKSRHHYTYVYKRKSFFLFTCKCRNDRYASIAFATNESDIIDIDTGVESRNEYLKYVKIYTDVQYVHTYAYSAPVCKMGIDKFL